VALGPFCKTWRSKPRHATHLLDLLAKRKEAILAEEIFWCMWKWRLEQCEVKMDEMSKLKSGENESSNFGTRLKNERRVWVPFVFQNEV